MRIVVIGAGLAGLCVAMRLAQHAQVRVLEASDRLGGQISTEHSDGFLVERGAEGFVARSELVPKLVRDLALGDDALIEQSVTRSYGFERGALKLLQPGEAASLLGFQVPPAELGRGIRSLRRGMGSLIDALAAHLDGRVSLVRCAPVTALERRARALVVHTKRAGSFEADAVVVATSSAHAAALLTPIAAQASALATAPTLSSVNVEFAFARDQIRHPLDATGFVVATDEQEHVAHGFERSIKRIRRGRATAERQGANSATARRYGCIADPGADWTRIR